MKVVKETGVVILALLAAVLAPLLIWVAAIINLWQAFARRRITRAQFAFSNLTCRIDADCPSGYVCTDGRCAPGPYQEQGSAAAG